MEALVDTIGVQLYMVQIVKETAGQMKSPAMINVSITVPFRFRVCLKHVNPGRFQECPAGGMARFPSMADEARTRLKKYLEKPISHQFH